MTKAKMISGMFYAKGEKGEFIEKSQITIRASRDEFGQTISLADEKNGVMLLIPVEPVADLIEVKE